jgi:hypothetical protein
VATPDEIRAAQLAREVPEQAQALATATEANAVIAKRVQVLEAERDALRSAAQEINKLIEPFAKLVDQAQRVAALRAQVQAERSA